MLGLGLRLGFRGRVRVRVRVLAGRRSWHLGSIMHIGRGVQTHIVYCVYGSSITHIGRGVSYVNTIECGKCYMNNIFLVIQNNGIELYYTHIHSIILVVLYWSACCIIYVSWCYFISIISYVYYTYTVLYFHI